MRLLVSPMTDYHIQPITRRCAVTGRDLVPGERFYTALIDDGGRFRRDDYSAEAWRGAPQGAFSFWAGKVPPLNTASRPRIDDDLLEECFQRLEASPDPARLNFRYVLALLLVRRKRLRFERSIVEHGVEHLVLRSVRTGETFHVADPRLGEAEMDAVQEEVFKVLGWS